MIRFTHFNFNKATYCCGNYCKWYNIQHDNIFNCIICIILYPTVKITLYYKIFQHIFKLGNLGAAYIRKKLFYND